METSTSSLSRLCDDKGDWEPGRHHHNQVNHLAGYVMSQ